MQTVMIAILGYCIITVIMILFKRLFVNKKTIIQQSQPIEDVPISIKNNTYSIEQGKDGEERFLSYYGGIIANIKKQKQTPPFHTIYQQYEIKDKYIDFILVGAAGILIVEVKNWNGYILGSDTSPCWVQILDVPKKDKEKLNAYTNGYTQVKEYHKIVSDLFYDYPEYKDKINFCIVFINCEKKEPNSNEVKLKKEFDLGLNINDNSIAVLYKQSQHQTFSTLINFYKNQLTLSNTEINQIECVLEKENENHRKDNIHKYIQQKAP